MKKSKKYNFAGIKLSETAIAVLILAIVLFYGGQQGWFKGGTSYERVQNETLIKTLEVSTSGSCSLTFSKGTYITTEIITGTITNGRNTNCNVYYQSGNNWFWLGVVNTGSTGRVSVNGGPISAPGAYTFRAICDACVTNRATITIVLPAANDNDGDGNPDATDPDDDNDGWTDNDENAAGTDPYDPTDHPEEEEQPDGTDYSQYTCGDLANCAGTCPATHPTCAEVFFVNGEYPACVCLNEGSQEIHPEWKPEGSQHNPISDTTPESYSCVDADAGLSVEARFATASYCTDDLGKHYDYCDTEGYIRDWYCVTSGTKKYCTDGTANNCPAYCGAGSVCTGGKCTITQPLGNPPGLGWSAIHGLAGPWYQATSYPEPWYPFNFNAGSKYIAVEYWVSHYPSGNFVDTMHPAKIRGVNAGNVVCNNEIYTDAQNHGIMLCIGTSTSSWSVEISNQKIENINWQVSYYTWSAP